MQKVLIVGGSGSLGTQIAIDLCDTFEVDATFCSNKKNHEKINYRFLDITDESSFNNLNESYNAVVFVTGLMPAVMNGYQPNKYFEINVSGALNVLEFCRKKEIKKVIYIMTFSDVAGHFYNGVPIRHDSSRTLNLVGDHAVYSISKVAACDLVEHYHQQYGLQTIVFRIPTVYCADNNINYFVDGEEKTKAYVKMIRDIVQNKKIEIWGNPQNTKDMPYVKDFSRLIKLAITSESAQGMYNAGTGNPVSLDEFVDALIDVFGEGKIVEKIYKPEMPSQPNFTFDMSRTIKEFNYRPEYDIHSMLCDIKEKVDPKTWLQKNI